MKPEALREYVALAQSDLAYREAPKQRFLVLGRQLAKQLAADLGLAPGTFDVRVHAGGIAVGGGVTLHAEHLYVSLEAGAAGGFMFRSCAGRDDYTGGTNNWASFSTLETDYASAVRMLRSAMELRAEYAAQVG